MGPLLAIHRPERTTMKPESGWLSPCPFPNLIPYTLYPYEVRPCAQVAILAGDFLLARASVSLAALRNTEVIELLSQVIEHLVSGEILQARPHFANALSRCDGGKF